jgi:uncharacterized membrane protein
MLNKMTTYNLIQVAAILLTGLVAGLFYSYDCSVIRGFRNIGDREYLIAFQSINRAILNPYFFVSFVGSLLVLPVAAWLSYKSGTPASFYLLIAATIVYAAGVFGVTMFGNVPLNNEVDQLNIAGATPDAISALRHKFETNWNRLNAIRTYASILSFLLAILSLLKKT